MSTLAIAQPPAGWQECDNGCWARAHWTVVGVPGDWDCNYDDCNPGECGAMQMASFLEIDGNVITVVVANWRSETRQKKVKIRLEGTGGDYPNAPSNGQITGISDEDPNSDVVDENAMYSVDVSGNWIVDFEATLIPQPDTMRFTVEVPGSPVLTDGWVDECCQAPKPIPSLSEWGMAVVALLLLISGVFIFRRKRATV